jgi:hypothetical protein
MSLVALIIASLALYRRLLGAWRRTYVITAVIVLYFNVFVLVVQLFRRVPVLTNGPGANPVRAPFSDNAARRLAAFRGTWHSRRNQECAARHAA